MKYSSETCAEMNREGGMELPPFSCQHASTHIFHISESEATPTHILSCIQVLELQLSRNTFCLISHRDHHHLHPHKASTENMHVFDSQFSLPGLFWFRHPSLPHLSLSSILLIYLNWRKKHRSRAHTLTSWECEWVKHKRGDVERNEKERWVEMKHKIAGDEDERREWDETWLRDEERRDDLKHEIREKVFKCISLSTPCESSTPLDIQVRIFLPPFHVAVCLMQTNIQISDRMKMRERRKTTTFVCVCDDKTTWQLKHTASEIKVMQGFSFLSMFVSMFKVVEEKTCPEMKMRVYVMLIPFFRRVNYRCKGKRVIQSNYLLSCLCHYITCCLHFLSFISSLSLLHCH